ncbi:hypothetical protein [Paraclostridium dentum]|uniref:hypothetical protein n=1 Tax=Paraclostridium dentum TaxID=2662455 RepID=UPI001475DC6B|nr:hypothetical protein [Paraclostridium dentum]
MLNQLSTSDKVQLCAILASSITAIISIIISVATLRHSKKISLESNRANIVFFFHKNKSEIPHRLVLKNFGKSSGKLLSIHISPNLSYENSNMNTKRPLITDCSNIFLAPNQSVYSCFDFRDYPDKVFKVSIKYETMKKIYNEEYTLDLNFRESILVTKPNISDELDGLIHINDSIQTLYDNM